MKIVPELGYFLFTFANIFRSKVELLIFLSSVLKMKIKLNIKVYILNDILIPSVVIRSLTTPLQTVVENTNNHTSVILKLNT